jgi:hypothetical protein
MASQLQALVNLLVRIDPRDHGKVADALGHVMTGAQDIIDTLDEYLIPGI